MYNELIIPNKDFMARPINGKYNLYEYYKEAKELKCMLKKKFKKSLDIDSLINVWFCYSMEFYNEVWKSIREFDNDDISKAMIEFIKYDREYSIPRRKNMLKYSIADLVNMIKNEIGIKELTYISNKYNIGANVLRNILNTVFLYVLCVIIKIVSSKT